jgi:hypothetical protein
MRILEDSSKEFGKSTQQELQQGGIFKEPYLEIMSAWSAFDATDINYDNEVEKKIYFRYARLRSRN